MKQIINIVALMLAIQNITSSTINATCTDGLRCAPRWDILAVADSQSRLQRYYAADRLMLMGVKAFRSGHYRVAHEWWSKLLATDSARLVVDNDDVRAKIPFIIKKSNSTLLFARLYQQYDTEGNQRPPSMPQIPNVLDRVFAAAEGGKLVRARDLLKEARRESPLLHRTDFIEALINIVEAKEDAAARDFLDLVVLPPEYVSPDIIGFSEEQLIAVRWLDKIARRRCVCMNA